MDAEPIDEFFTNLWIIGQIAKRDEFIAKNGQHS